MRQKIVRTLFIGKLIIEMIINLKNNSNNKFDSYHHYFILPFILLKL